LSQPFTLDDFRLQFVQILKMKKADSFANWRGIGDKLEDPEGAEAAMRRAVQIIDAMLPEERDDPNIIDDLRRNRIADTAKTEPEQVSGLLKQFEMVREMMERMQSMTLWQRIKLVLGFGTFPGAPPDAT